MYQGKERCIYCQGKKKEVQAFVEDLSQMATYWFVIGWFNNQRAQKSKVRQVAKDVVKSKVYP